MYISAFRYMNRIAKKLDKLLGNSIQKEDDIYLFGFNNLIYSAVIELERHEGYRLKGILDNGKEKWVLDGTVFQKPSEVLSDYNPKARILIASSAYAAIVQEILTYDKRYKNSIFVLDQVKRNKKFKQMENWIYCSFPNWYHRRMNDLGFWYFSYAYKREYELLKKNKRFKDIHKGQRCFILGNGPSLNHVDTHLLQNEIIFAGNQIMDTVVWDKIHVKYWACMDASFFNIGMEYAVDDFHQKLLKMKDVVEEYFIYLEFLPYIQKYELDKELSVNYISRELRQYCDAKDEPIEEIRIDRFGIDVYNLVTFCVQIAIYMGFSEIYLLGCDQSVVYNLLQKELGLVQEKQHVEMNAPDISDKISTRRTHMPEYGMIQQMRNKITQRRVYMLLQEYCDRNGIVFRNLTETTTLTEIHRGSLNEIVRSHEDEKE